MALLTHAAEHPGRLALRVGAREVSYAEAARLARAFAAELGSRGVGPGDRVAVIGPNGLPFALAVHATALLGAVLVPLHPALPPAAIEPLLARAAPRVVLDAAGLAAMAAHAETASPRAALPAEVRADAPATILFTSGTTGTPRAVVLTHGNHAASAAASAARLETGPGDVWLGSLPFHHVGGLAVLLRAAHDGGAVEVHERFDPAAVADALARGRVTCASLVARMLERTLAEAPATGFSPALRAVLVGGGPAPEPLLARARAAGLPVARTYGLTEAASQVATQHPGDADDTCGRPLPGVEVRIEGDEGPGEAGAEGEILVRGATVMVGYDGETPLAPGSWLRTGDIGRLRPDGCLAVLDRRTDLIVTGGENVYPARVEAALAAHPAIEEVCVVAAPDASFGQRVVAVLRLREGMTAGAAALEAHARNRLARHEMPREWRFAGAPLPRTAGGKLSRALVRDAWLRRG